MAKHSNGRMNWKISDIVIDLIKMRLIWGGVGLLIVVVTIVILETTGLGGK